MKHFVSCSYNRKQARHRALDVTTACAQREAVSVGISTDRCLGVREKSWNIEINISKFDENYNLPSNIDGKCKSLNEPPSKHRI
jgi:hypothetical protein